MTSAFPIDWRTSRPRLRLARFFMLKSTQLRLASLIGIIACFAHVARAEDPVVVEDFDERPVAVKAYPPAYPTEMLKQGVSGLVNVAVVIDASGNVVDRSIAKATRPEFERPALDAVRKWKFKPGKKAGTPVAVRMVLPVAFTFQP